MGVTNPNCSSTHSAVTDALTASISELEKGVVGLQSIVFKEVKARTQAASHMTGTDQSRE